MRNWLKGQRAATVALIVVIATCIGGCGDQSPKSAKQDASTAVVSTAVSPVQSVDGKKVVRLAFPAAESGFDPVTAPDLYSGDRKSTRLNSSHRNTSRMPSSA